MIKKFLLVFTALISSLSLTSCKVNWFNTTLDMPWYLVVIPTVAAVVAVTSAAYAIIISRTYVCPECKSEIKPKWNDFSVCLHYGGKRVVKCRNCGRKGLCERKKKK